MESRRGRTEGTDATGSGRVSSRAWARLRSVLRLDRFLSGEGGPQPGPVELHRRRVYILPSAAGYGFAALLLLLLLSSINYGNSLGFVLTFLLGGTAWITMHHTYRNLVRLQVSGGHPVPVFTGGQARFPIELDNPAGPSRYALQLQAISGDRTALDVADHGTAILARLAPRRGRLELGRFRIGTRYPLGLFHAWSHVDLGLRCVVFPRPAAPGEPPPSSPADAAHRGDQGRGNNDFSGFRGYQPGDSSRHVYWKGLARSETMLTKLFGGDAVEELWLDWEATGEIDDEARLSRLCRWILDADTAGRAYGLRLPGREIAPARGDSHRQLCLTALALFGLDTPAVES